jgi:LysM repeat protein
MQQTELKAKNEGPQKSAPLSKDTKSSEAIVRYKVRKGDTVSSIARQFQLSPRTLLAANSRNRQTDIRIGEQLNIPVNASKNQE